MRDPHVAYPYYRLECEPTLSFESPPPIEAATDAFKLRLEDRRVTVELLGGGSRYLGTPQTVQMEGFGKVSATNGQALGSEPSVENFASASVTSSV